uniref:Uncharacterized protein n=1 Tax=Lepeophtheirus salmonis TaxID=72036 RepID=A0A0K2UWC3_LEPSM
MIARLLFSKHSSNCQGYHVNFRLFSIPVDTMISISGYKCESLLYSE